MDLNKFWLIFQKVQHSHSRHQKTTSNFLRINLKGNLRFIHSWPLEGAMYITLWWHFRGHPENFSFFTIFSKYWWFQTKWFTGLLELLQIYKQNPLEKFFIFTIYQNYIGFKGRPKDTLNGWYPANFQIQIRIIVMFMISYTLNHDCFNILLPKWRLRYQMKPYCWYEL